MPNTSGSAKKKCGSNEVLQDTSNNCTNCNSRNISGSSITSGGSGKARKRKRCEIVQLSDSDLESELDDCNLEHALAIEKKLRKVAKINALSDEEMRKLLQKFVKNEHILALVTLKAEDELARERREAEQRAIIITDTPSVPKLTRAKARELNKTPNITLSALNADAPQADITALIKDDLHSDEEDEEYTFKEEDFISDDDPNTTASDLDSNPRTPLTPLTQTDYEDSPVKFTADGCFKIPLDKCKNTEENLRIAARTRSKLCLQETTIEDLQSEFVPPDVEYWDVIEPDPTGTDEDWMQFLNDFSKPLNSTLAGDDDDPVNDPEYVAAEKIPVDAEELRDVNISKKELTELVAELFEGLINEGVSLESIDLETPQKFIENNAVAPASSADSGLNTPDISPEKQSQIGGKIIVSNEGLIENVDEHLQVVGQVGFGVDHMATAASTTTGTQHVCVSDATISSTNITQNEYSFHPDVVSTPAPCLTQINRGVETTLVPVGCAVAGVTDMTYSPGTTISIPTASLNSEPQLIAVPVPGQPNCFQLAKVVRPDERPDEQTPPIVEKLSSPVNTSTKDRELHPNDTRYTVPYDNNFTWEYISIKKHVYSEYMDKFERLRLVSCDDATALAVEQPPASFGFSQAQHDLLQQQLRIHVQFLTQHFMQTYSHPDFWKLAPKAKEMLVELEKHATTDASFAAWNLPLAMELVKSWEHDLTEDTPENAAFMDFIHNEIQLTNRNTRQIPRFPPRVMEVMLNSQVFMYPQYLPRIPFTPKVISYQIFAPAESLLIARGLEQHMKLISDQGERMHKSANPLIVACSRLNRETVFGKNKRRIWDHIKALKSAKYYNPVKYFFEHNKAPPMEQQLFTFPNNTVLPPKKRVKELPLAWRKYVEQLKEPTSPPSEPVKPTTASVSDQARICYLEFVREAVGENIQLPENLLEAAEPNGNATDISAKVHSASKRRRKREKSKQPTSLTINVNYVFNTSTSETVELVNTNANSPNTTSLLAPTSKISTNNTPQSSKNCSESQIVPIVYNFDYNNHILQPVADQAVEVRNDTSERQLTDFYKCEQVVNSTQLKLEPVTPKSSFKKHNRKNKFGRQKFTKKHLRRACRFKLPTHTSKISQKRSQELFRHNFKRLLTIYRWQLQTQERPYKKNLLVHFVYKYVRALDLYSNFLVELKMFCRNATTNSGDGLGSAVPTVSPNNSNSVPNTAAQSPTSLSKRARPTLQQTLEEEVSAASRTRKVNRQEENFRHMLLPNTPEDTNRKDAIFAFNFYEKVEEVLKSSKHPEDCKRFNHILKSFDPKRDKVSDLYYKMENLLLPDHPELVEVFLTFLLPAEAAEIGKFFEHFIITSMSTFVSKLNVYFNKQPAQIRKIYNCLNELAEEADVSIKKVKAKILPMLKGNQFLIDWFLQQFPEEPPPERLLPVPEHVSLKEVQCNQSGDFVENVIDLLDSPTQEQQAPTHCQLRYINGRIFYGTKITLPAKLSFMAANCQQEQANSNSEMENNFNGCVHGMREHGETRLAAATAAAANEVIADCNSDDNDKSEEEEVAKAIVIDTTIVEEENTTSVETCDDTTLRAHAVRLNPNYYGNSCYTSATSTPNPSSIHTSHHGVKKTALSFNEEGKVSPRKSTAVTTCTSQLPSNTNNTNINTSTGTSSCSGNNSVYHSPGGTANAALTSSCNSQLREKRKSPTKKNKSPMCATSVRPTRSIHLQPMVVIHEQNSAIACAKKLKSLIEEDSNEMIDCKESINIVARTKASLAAAMAAESGDTPDACAFVAKMENMDHLEFLPEDAEISGTLSQSSFPLLKVDIDSNDEQDPEDAVSSVSQSQFEPSTHFDSDEDRKLDMVATLATANVDSLAAASTTSKQPNKLAAIMPSTAAAVSTAYQQTAWTRDEDKIILIEMKLGSRDRHDLFRRVRGKLPARSLSEITARYQFLMDFLSKLQGN